MIYKILTDAEWESAQNAGEFTGSTVDLKDGFIHFSTAAQVRETAAKHFAGQGNLILLGVDEKSLCEKLKWEVSRGGDLFPHLYDSLPTVSVVSAISLNLDSDGNQFFPDSIYKF